MVIGGLRKEALSHGKSDPSRPPSLFPTLRSPLKPKGKDLLGDERPLPFRQGSQRGRPPPPAVSFPGMTDDQRPGFGIRSLGHGTGEVCHIWDHAIFLGRKDRFGWDVLYGNRGGSLFAESGFWIPSKKRKKQRKNRASVLSDPPACLENVLRSSSWVCKEKKLFSWVVFPGSRSMPF